MAGKKKHSAAAASTSGVKRTRAETAAVDDEDAFEVGPSRARSQQAAPTSEVEADEPGEMMDQCRICPRVLVKAVKGLNFQQIRAVKELGFDSLFHLQVETVPSRLLAWCLDKFDPVSCSIEVPDHAPLHISAEDVYLVFGFPRGPLQIESVARTRDKALVLEWTTMFDKSQYNVRPSDIVARMKAEVDGGIWFKRLFLMLLESCLFENAADGYVKPKVMDILRDVTKIRDHNWCDHMISCLRRGHERWVDNNHRKFNGPSVFLAVSNSLLHLIKLLLAVYSVEQCISRARAMQNLKIERLQLPWSNETNKVDSGVYAMRHMETFMGGCVKDWSVGLESNADVVLQALRVKYTKTILTSDVNKKCGDVLNRVGAWFSGLRSVKKAA